MNVSRAASVLLLMMLFVLLLVWEVFPERTQIIRSAAGTGLLVRWSVAASSRLHRTSEWQP